MSTTVGRSAAKVFVASAERVQQRVARQRGATPGGGGAPSSSAANAGTSPGACFRQPARRSSRSSLPKNSRYAVDSAPAAVAAPPGG